MTRRNKKHLIIDIHQIQLLSYLEVISQEKLSNHSLHVSYVFNLNQKEQQTKKNEEKKTQQEKTQVFCD